MSAHHSLHLKSGATPTSWADDEIANGKASKANSTPGRIKSQRQIRALQALLNGPIRREHLDRTCGVSNGPELIARLRARGLKIICDESQAVIDRDGREAYPGVYSLHSESRAKAIGLLKNSEVAGC
jgi:hypothetical protein